MTVIGTSMMEKVADIVKRCPDLDLLGINSYGDIYTLSAALKKYGWTKPFLISEWGPDGYWEVRKTPWVDSLNIGNFVRYQAVMVEPGSIQNAKVTAHDPDNDPMKYQWEIRPEAKYAAYAGQGEKVPEPVPEL